MKIMKKAMSIFLTVLLLVGILPMAQISELDLSGMSVMSYAATDSSFRRGDVIEYGYYPQSKVTDDTVIEELDSIDSEWISYCYYYGNGGDYNDASVYDYMKYRDVVYNGAKYRSVMFTAYRTERPGYESVGDYSAQDDNGFYTNTIYWFKYDPIRWRVLDPSTGMVFCESIIDSQAFTDTMYRHPEDKDDSRYYQDTSYTHLANSFSSSSLKHWLNYYFCNVAFSSRQQNILREVTVSSPAYTQSYSHFNDGSCSAKVYLLSWDELQNATLGAIASASGTDYARCQGLGFALESGFNYWLRSPGMNGYAVVSVTGSGSMHPNRAANRPCLGVRPVIHLDLTEEINNEYDESVEGERITFNGQKKDYYGAETFGTSKAGEVQDAAVEFKEAMQLYYDAFYTEGQKKIGNTDDLVSLSDLAKQLKAQDKASSSKYVTMYQTVPEDCLDSIYYALANYLTNVVNNNVDMGKIDFNKSSTYNAGQIVKACLNGFRSNEVKTNKGNYDVIIKGMSMWDAFANNTITATKTTGRDRGTQYTGILNSTEAQTRKVLTTYFECMSDVVKDALKRTLFSVFSELKDITGIASYEKQALEEFFKNKVEILQEKGFGNVLGLFMNIRTGYNAIKPILQATIFGNLNASLTNAKGIYNAIKDLQFSRDGIKAKAIKDSLKSVEKAKEKLANKLYNYIYNIDEKEETTSWWDGLKNVLGFKCPVEFEVYDESGNLIGFVDSSDNYEDYIWFSEDLLIETDGDAKFVYAPANKQITIQMVATEDGSMDYTIERIDGNTQIERINYYDVPLIRGQKYTQTIAADVDLETQTEELALVGDEVVLSDEYLKSDDMTAHVKVTCETTPGCVVIGGGLYPYGDLVKLVALSDNDDAVFVGWYKGDELISNEEICRFTARDDITIIAVFVERKNLDLSYSYSFGELYQNSLLEITNNDGMKTIRFLVDSSNIEKMYSVTYNLYDSTGNMIRSETTDSVEVEVNKIYYSGVRFENAETIIFEDADGNCIVTLTKSSATPALGDFVLDKNGVSLRVGESIKINALPIPYDAAVDELVWISSDTSVATVDNQGHVVAQKKGKATIYANCDDIDFSLQCSVTVEAGDECNSEHVFGDWKEESEPTCTQRGIKTRECIYCDELQTEQIPATGHSYGDWTVTIPADCQNTGVEQRVCENDISHVETRETPKTDHTDKNGDGLCDVCHNEVGDSQGGSSDDGNRCKYCGQVHEGFWGKIVGFFHKIAYFFAHLFGKM